MQLTVLQDSSKTFFSIFGESCAYGKMRKTENLKDSLSSPRYPKALRQTTKEKETAIS